MPVIRRFTGIDGHVRGTTRRRRPSWAHPGAPGRSAVWQRNRPRVRAGRRSAVRPRSTSGGMRRSAPTCMREPPWTKPPRGSVTPARRWPRWSATSARASWSCSPSRAGPAPRRDHPGILRRRAVFHRQPQRRSQHGPLRASTGPPRRVPHPPRRRLRHRHPRHPPAPLPRQLRNHHQRRRHHHRPYRPARLLTRPPPGPSPPTPPSPGGTAVASTSSSANNEAK